MENKREQENTQSDTFDRDFQMLTYFQNEYEYRHKNYWDILIKLFILTTVVTILPVISGIFGLEITYMPRGLLFCFPMLGLVISVLNVVILYDKAKKFNAIGRVKHRINLKMEEPLYHYEFFNKDYVKSLLSDNDEESKKEKKINFLSYKMIWFVFSVEVAIVVCVVIALCLLPQPVTV